VGILLLSLVMLKEVVSSSIAYLGIATGCIGAVGETLRPVFGVGYSVYGVLLLVWFVVIGWTLHRLGRSW
jgi:tetrahydromethanopterin S-methyltransferase subunit C